MNRRCLACVVACSASLLNASDARDASLTSTYSASISYTAEGEVERHGKDLGDLSVTWTRASYALSGSIDDRWRWHAGPWFEFTHFDVSPRALLPDEGYVTALQLGGVWQINPRWTARLDIRPGLYSDFEDISGSDFNAPFVVAVTYASSSNVLWVLGLGVNWRSDLGTIGGPGVRWQFAEDWTLNLVLPKPTIDYQLTRDVAVYAGGEWRSSYFRVNEHFGTSRSRPVLNDDDFTYRELRALAGARWAFSRQLYVNLEGGYAFNRRAEFRDADVTMKIDGAPFVQLGVGGAF